MNIFDIPDKPSYLPLRDGLIFKPLSNDVDDRKINDNEIGYDARVLCLDDNIEYILTLSQSKNKKILFDLFKQSLKNNYQPIKLVVKQVGKNGKYYNNYKESHLVDDPKPFKPSKTIEPIEEPIEEVLDYLTNHDYDNEGLMFTTFKQSDDENKIKTDVRNKIVKNKLDEKSFKLPEGKSDHDQLMRDAKYIVSYYVSFIQQFNDITTRDIYNRCKAIVHGQDHFDDVHDELIVPETKIEIPDDDIVYTHLNLFNRSKRYPTVEIMVQIIQTIENNPKQYDNPEVKNFKYILETQYFEHTGKIYIA